MEQGTGFYDVFHGTKLNSSLCDFGVASRSAGTYFRVRVLTS